jgi:Tfp pilus assembly protein FimT
MMERNAVSTTGNEILGALLYARSEAVRTERLVTFTPETDGWLVTNEDEADIVDQTVDNINVTLVENIANDSVTYNARGRANITEGDGIEIHFDGSLRGRVCISLTGRPYLKTADEGDCP